ncbi:hypothetical protein J6590_012448 [Homalodisca vitripennis]|nr:hypothetical protein J6590_012448 [Homalodisca vitripennis]
MNEENENFVRKKNAKMQKELEDAAKDMRGLSPDSFSLNNVGPVLLCASVPTKPSLKFVRFQFYFSRNVLIFFHQKKIYFLCFF